MNAPIPPDQTQDPMEAFIVRWQGREGGQVRANYALFLSEMCDALGLQRPDPAEASRFGEKAAKRPSIPAGAVEQTATVFAALAAASGPLDAGAIADAFRKSKNLEKSIAGVFASLARLGHIAKRNGKMFEIRRAA